MSAGMDPTRTPMYALGLLVLAGVAVYFLFLAVNTVGLSEDASEATVVDKRYLAPGQTYRTEIIGGRSYVRPQATPDMYLLELDLGDDRAHAAVSPELYESIQIGDPVLATVQRRRLTGVIQVTEVRRER